MQIEIFCLAGEFAEFIKETASIIGAHIYTAESRELPMKCIENEDFLAHCNAYKILVGYEEAFSKIEEKPAISLYLKDILDFVSIRFGDISSTQISASICLARSSKTSIAFSKAIKKILRKKTKADVIFANKETTAPNFFYTEAAAKTGKRFVQHIGSNVEFKSASM